MSRSRYCNTPFPAYRFIPGENPHPLKEGGHMFLSGEPKVEKIIISDKTSHIHFLYSLDLFNHGFYWESHCWLEAIWNAHERTGDIALLSQGIIKLAAAAIKIKMNQKKVSLDHLNRAYELFSQIKESNLVGINMNKLLNLKNLFSEDIENYDLTKKSDYVFSEIIKYNWP